MDDDAAGPRGRLATLLRGHRIAAGLTQRQLADRARVSLGALEDLEQGRTSRPRGQALSRLAGALDLSQAEVEALTGATARSGPAAEGRGTQPWSNGLRVGVLGPLAVPVGDAARRNDGPPG
jgi:transcriptional regulator with XRE-family HTH domain